MREQVFAIATTTLSETNDVITHGYACFVGDGGPTAAICPVDGSTTNVTGCG